MQRKVTKLSLQINLKQDNLWFRHRLLFFYFYNFPIDNLIFRFRWHNHLDPMVRKSPWNESEEFVFIEAHKLHGNKWAEIAKMIPGR